VTRLNDAGVVNLVWNEDETGVYAKGHQEYEIDENNEIATFVGEKCVSIRDAADFPHAVSMVLASEAVCAYKIREKARRVAAQG
jgi:IMP cyclohydrolase